jgi:NAD(P)-dependent dehydrogenase (short-subunit alcohol dehydrogenase family)
VAAGNHQANGWSNSNYAISKLALIAATNVLARQYPV